MSRDEHASQKSGVDSDGRDSSERRHATVLFADLAGFTAFSERRGEEAAYSLMQHLSALMTGAVREEGGTVRSFTGDGVMALFGVPVALEDAPLRACRAALKIQKRLAAQTAELEIKYGIRPQMRIGINTGPIIAGTVSSGESTAMTAIGDTVNLAARLQGLAEPGAVVLSEATYRLVQGLVGVRPGGEHEIKGKAEKQKTYWLNSILPGATRFARSVSVGLTTFVGRSQELDVLERAFRSTTPGVRVIDIVGEPGIGKSRLVHEFRQRIADQRAFVLTGSCTPDGQQTPFLPFIDIVRGSFRVSEGEAESQIARKLDKGLSLLGLAGEQHLGLLFNLLGLKAPEGSLTGLDGVLIGLRTRDLLVRLLQERCRLAPVVMLLEDLHWIDSASEEVLARVIAVDELALLIVETHRGEYAAPWANHKRVSTLKLQPLAAIDTTQIIRARLNVVDLPATLAQLVTSRAEGNPLFAEEIASDLLERGAVRRTSKGIAFDAESIVAALPTTIQSLLSARVDRLPAEDRSLLQAAAAIGRRFGRDLLAAVSRLEALDSRLSRIQALDLIHPDATSDGFVFKHALVRDALYDSLLKQPKKSLHLAIAAELEQRSHNRLTEVVEALAHHYGQTDRADKWFTYLVMAGEKALGVYSLGDAERYFQHALSLFEAKACTDDIGLVRLLADMSYVLSMIHEPGRLARLIERYRSRIEALADLPATVIVLAHYVYTLGLTCRFHSALPVAQQALNMALRLDDDRSKAYARSALVLANSGLDVGDIEETDRHAQLSVSEGDRTDDCYLQSWTRFAGAWNFVICGMTNRGRALAVELQERGRARGDPRAAAIGLWLLGWLDIFDESYEDALLHGQEAIEISITPFDREIGEQVKGTALISLGKVAEGAGVLSEARRRAMACEFFYCRTATDGAVGAAMVLQGDFSGGVRFLESSIKDHERTGNTFARDFSRIILAEIYLEFLAPKAKPPLSIIIRHLPFLISTAFTGRRKAMKLLREARSNTRFSSNGYLCARIDTNLGILCRLAKQNVDADKHLRHARVIAEQLDAKALLAKIDAAAAPLRIA
jgi:class 3 adenylate cyclase/tetratricopeptide (TPR) repeat protein